MATIYIPAIWMALDTKDARKVYRMFRKLLNDVTVSHNGLADEIGVDQSTVSRWASGKSTPSTEQMKAVAAAIQAHTAKVEHRVQRTRELLLAVEVAVNAWSEVAGRKATPSALKKHQAAAQAVHRVLRRK